MSKTLEIIHAVNRISSAMTSEMRNRPTETCQGLAQAIDATVAAGQPLDDMFVARTVWALAHRTDGYSPSYANVMPNSGPNIERSVAVKTPPDDLVALAKAGWSSTYSGRFYREVKGKEWRLRQSSDRWVLSHNDMEEYVVRDIFEAPTAEQAIKRFEELTGPTLAETRDRVAAAQAFAAQQAGQFR